MKRNRQLGGWRKSKVWLGAVLALLVLVAAPALSSTNPTSSDSEETLALGGVPNEAIQVHPPVANEDDGEWRALGKEESVPVGSHVRLDMTTGERTIKVDPKESCSGKIEDKSSVISQQDGLGDFESLEKAALSIKDREHLAVKEMEKILKELPEPEPMLGNLDKSRMSPEEYEAAIKKIWASRQAMIKEAMESMQNEAEDMKRHLALIVADNATSTSILYNLEMLRELVETIDNSQDFVTLGGLEVCDLILNHEDQSVRTSAAHLIGGTVRHLPHLQLSAAKLRIIGLLVENLRDGLATLSTQNIDESSRSDCENEIAKVIYALGSILRGSKDVQQIATQKWNVMPNLEKVILSPHTSMGLRSKVLSLASDLLQESYCDNDLDDSIDMIVIPNNEQDNVDTDTDATQQCQGSPVRDTIQWEQWCNVVYDQIKRGTQVLVEVSKIGQCDPEEERELRRSTSQAMTLLRDLATLKESIAPYCDSAITATINQGAKDATETVQGLTPTTMLSQDQLDVVVEQLAGLV